MVETVIALLMIVNNEISEARIQTDLSSCLKGKRLAMRQVENNSRVIFSCVKTKAELEKNIDGSYSIKKLIME
tara:strand:- start:15 stop:233 length:219 start_codon:yes stop_codon:yes gene_type:complete